MHVVIKGVYQVLHLGFPIIDCNYQLLRICNTFCISVTGKVEYKDRTRESAEAGQEEVRYWKKCKDKMVLQLRGNCCSLDRQSKIQDVA